MKTKDREPHHIIAIGASAGGMEEINSFFDHTPLDEVSYVIIQHLSSDFKSRMVQLLSGHSKLVVKEAEDGMKVECNKVYLIPNDKFMTISGGKLYLTDKEKTKTPKLTINRFFDSLAEDCGHKAIAIILSGLGSDGTEGIKAIKKAGGMVIARDPETSEFGSMPSNAIATGMVDFVLEPELMPNAIEDYIKYGAKLVYDNGEDEKNINAIIDLIKEKSPLDFTDYKQPTILRRTKRRSAQNNFTSLEKYLEHLKVTPEEVEALTKDFLISVTSFFRDKEAFDIIQKNVLPQLLEKLEPGEELKMWVAGCATGEEAYSLAILIAEQLTGKFKDTVVKIFATDIDSIALVNATKGVYNEGITKNVSPERLEAHFIKEGKNYRVKPDIRKMVIFAQHDLIKNPPYCNMQLISCRNLMIYMTPILQKKVFGMLLYGLKMGGGLFLGPSENPMPIIRTLEEVSRKWKIYKNLEKKRVLRFDAFSLPDLFDVKRIPFSSAGDAFNNTNNSLDEIIHESLADEVDYLAVCIDKQNHVIKSYGDTTKYLLQKNFNSNLEELLQKPLALAFNSLIAIVQKTNQKAVVNGIKIKNGKSISTISMSVRPLQVKKAEQGLLMVTFNKEKSSIPAKQEGPIFDEKLYLDQYLVNLEETVKELKEKLNSAYEQLDSSNENMQSFNEELISANEEMQSTNEEMQSMNEELDTINSDYQLKNKELQEINDDLNNYFRSNINGQLFINNNLVLMKFSPGTVKLINLQETDIGRPLSNITTNIKFETLIKDTKKVLSDGSIITREVETNNGKWYQAMTMPYVMHANNQRSGVIITFNDITELKKAELALDKKSEGLLRINEDLENFVYTASHDLLAPLVNIEGSIEVINTIEVTDPEINKFLSIIDLSVKKFRSLIREISTVAKLDGDSIAKEKVDLDEMLNNIEWSLEDKIKLSGAVITRDLKVSHILFSKKNLRSILYNLISNAIKFKSDESLVIHVNTEKKGNNVILSVQDNGIGIPKSSFDRIFKMYGRLQENVEGQGIGLYLVKKIVHAAGGDVIVKSEQGKGSKFIINFKVQAAHLKVAALPVLVNQD